MTERSRVIADLSMTMTMARLVPLERQAFGLDEDKPDASQSMMVGPTPSLPAAAVMMDHDKNVGSVLEKIDELGIAGDTIVLYSTPSC